jgi:hypothetical protein
MVEKLIFNYLPTALVDIPAGNANCTLPQLETSVALCCVTTLRVAFIFLFSIGAVLGRFGSPLSSPIH